MENTILPGDRIWVNKLYFGARLPKKIEEIPWLNLLYFLTFRRGLSDSPQYERNIRMLGFSPIKHNDLLVFNQPLDLENYFVKRCVAVPKDTIDIRDTLVVVNGHPAKGNDYIKQVFMVCFKTDADYKTILNHLGIEFADSWYDRTKNCKEINISEQQKRELRDNESVLAVTRISSSDSTVDEELFARTKIVVEDFVIPFKGMKLKLDSSSYNRYKSVISGFEKIQLIYRNGKFYTATDAEITEYTFIYNYYYVLGDNRDFSSDSRVWGLVPEYCIVGKPSFVLYSNATIKRMFHGLR